MTHAADVIPITLGQIGTVRSYPAGSYLFFEGDRSQSVLLVVSGLLRIERASADGKVALLDLVASGSLVGELGVVDRSPRSATAVTVERTSVRVISDVDFRRVLDTDAEFAAALLRRVVGRMRKLTDQFVNVANRNGTARIADRLVELLDRSGLADSPGVLIHMPITQAELGQWAGLSREGASNALAELRDSGIVSTGRKSVEIHKPDRLRELARTQS